MLYLDQRRLSYFGVALAALTIFDLSFNAVTALNKISYVSQAQFANYTKALVKASQQNRQTDHGLYRIAKDFARPKMIPFKAISLRVTTLVPRWSQPSANFSNESANQPGMAM